MKKIEINSNKNSYSIFIGKNILKYVGNFIKKKLKYCCKILVVTDCLVYKTYGETIKKSLKEAGYVIYFFVLKNSEKSKNFVNLLKIYHFSFEIGLTKKDVVLAFGGGMVCDVAGFFASTYLRGLKLINVPTSLLCQVDAAVGGKNAVNFRYGKNIIGTIFPPSLVICDVCLLKSLNRRFFVSGMAEVIKYAAVFSKNFFEFLLDSDVYENVEEIVFNCIKIKKFVVEKDEQDKNFRLSLNFGHTIGHAIEKISGYFLTHGEAVSIGMCYITQKSLKKGITNFDDFIRLKTFLRRFSLPTTTKYSNEEILRSCMFDKKRFGDIFKICVILEIGCFKLISLTKEEFKEFLRWRLK